MHWFDETLERWKETVEQSCFTLPGISRTYNVGYTNLKNWFYDAVTPNKKSIERMEKIMTDLQKRGGANPISPELWLCNTGAN